MGFRLYFAGADRLHDPLPPESNCGFLNSYAVGPKGLSKFLENTKNQKVFVDSGAYSVNNSGATVNIDEYIDFINSHDEPLVWAQLDVIPKKPKAAKDILDATNGTWENYLYMMEKLTPQNRKKLLPVYHFGEPYSALLRILNTEVYGSLPTYIALGGGYGGNVNNLMRYYTNMFDIIKHSKNPNVKVHAFGMTRFDYLDKFPFYSADSTTWLMTSINGKIHCYKSGKTIVVSDRQATNAKDHINHFHPEKRQLILDEIEKYGNGVTLEELSTDYNARLRYNRNFFQWWADRYEYKPVKNIPIPKKLF